MNIYQYTGDLAMWLYVATIFTATWALGLLGYWWFDTKVHQHDKATSTFYMIVIIIFGHLLNTLISIAMRGAVVNQGFAQHYSLFRSYWWSFRIMSELIGIVWLDIFYTYRMIYGEPVLHSNGKKTVVVQDAELLDGEIKECFIKNAHVKYVVVKGTVKEVGDGDGKEKL
jgi:hypothetical protein